MVTDMYNYRTVFLIKYELLNHNELVNMKKRCLINLMFAKTWPQIQNHSDLFLINKLFFIIIHFNNSNIKSIFNYLN